LADNDDKAALPLQAWDTIEAYDGVSVLVYHKTRRTFILVRQFRPAVRPIFATVGRPLDQAGIMLLLLQVWAAITRSRAARDPAATQAEPKLGM
jgi:hypothetical protein